MPAPRFFHYAGIFILFAWSGVLLYFYASNRVDFLLKGNFQYGPLLGGLGLAVMGFFNLFTARAEVGCGHDHHDHHDSCGGHDEESHEHEHEHASGCCGHNHQHEGHDHEDDDHSHIGHSHDAQTVPSIIATIIIVLVPTFTAAALSQNSFSVDALASKGLYSNEATARPQKEVATTSSDRYTLADLEKQVRKNEEGHFLIPVPSLFYSAADEELADVLKGLPIETTGQVAPEIAENDPNGTRLRFYRLFVSCCLADARPIGLSAEFGKTPPEFTKDCWVKIVGEMTYPEKDGRPVPIIEVKTIEAIPEPKDMMY